MSSNEPITHLPDLSFFFLNSQILSAMNLLPQLQDLMLIADMSLNMAHSPHLYQ